MPVGLGPYRLSEVNHVLHMGYRLKQDKPHVLEVSLPARIIQVPFPVVFEVKS